jgi:hypothetical protein
MGLATHLGPWLLGTVKNTTGTTAGLIRNTGITTVVQSSTSIAFGASAASTGIVVPAGSLLTDLFIIQTTQFTSGSAGTLTVALNGTAMGVATVTGAGSLVNIVLAPTSITTALLWLNTGTTDAIVTVTGATLTAGAGILCAHYGVRNADGTSAPTSFTA